MYQPIEEIVTAAVDKETLLERKVRIQKDEKDKKSERQKDERRKDEKTKRRKDEKTKRQKGKRHLDCRFLKYIIVCYISTRGKCFTRKVPLYLRNSSEIRTIGRV